MLGSIQSLRDRLSIFVSEREWGKFHQPKNVMLALAAECGELCEIFQWKGEMEGLNGFDSSDVTHVGEEIADVFIYSTRLSDLCCFDLPNTIREQLCLNFVKSSDKFGNVHLSANGTWNNLTFDELNSFLSNPSCNYPLANAKSPRDISFGILTALGNACSVFASKTEKECLPGLPGWSKEQVSTLAISIATICILLSCMSRISNLSLVNCIQEKIEKNERKYPVDLVRGSSAKYTAYQKKIEARKQSFLSNPLLRTGFTFTTVFFIGILFGMKNILNF